MNRWSLLSAALAVVAGTAHAETYVPGSANDPMVRESDYLSADAHYFSALATLEQLPSTQVPESQLAPDYARKLADDSLDFGMRERAGRLYQQIAATSKDPVDIGKAQLRLAEFDFQRGYLSEATDELSRMQTGLPKALLPDWKELMTRVLLAQGRYAEADKLFGDLDDNRKSTQYMRYNLGVAKINEGQLKEGHDLLDRVGRYNAVDDEGLALRDKANLVLAFDFLRREEGGTAVPIFQRIRLDGPFSNRALLGLGWAEMAPRGRLQTKNPNEDQSTPFGSFSTIGTILRPGYLDDALNGNRRVYSRVHTGTDDQRSLVQRALDLFRPGALEDKEARHSAYTPAQEAAFKRALVPWVELLGRDPMDPAVQEGMLAIPYTLDRLGAHEQAQQFYLRAIAALEQTRKRLAAAVNHVKSGRMIATIIHRDADAETGWTWRLKDLPDAPETFYLQKLLAENRFQEGLKDYRDARLLSRNLDAWATRLIAMQASYSDRGATVTPVQTVMDYVKKESQAPLKYDVVTSPKLQLAEHLSPPGDTRFEQAQAPEPLQLEAAKAPAAKQFDSGVWERMESLKQRIAVLKPKLDDAAQREKSQLEAVAIDELQRQDKVAETYLVQARLALARLYDRRGGDQP